uniref:Transposase Tc1-like domain-containing protein n=1 Tax=Cyprinus carpio carpio TaxID=630221 RepID=A0A9J7ZIZ9_CYPCA
MGKTADLTAVQKAIIDTLKREGKTQKDISERIGCSQSAVSRHLSGKSVGRKKCGKKRCTTRRGDRTLRKIVEKDRFQTLGDLRKQWTESGVETSRATVHRRVLLSQKQRQKRLTWATEKQHWTVAQWSKVLFSDESTKKCCTTRRGDRTLRKIVEKDRFQTLGDLRKQWTESGVETSRATVHRRVLLSQKQRQKRLTWATEKQHWTVAQWSKVLFSDESKFCMSFGNQGARVWRKTGEKEMPKCLKSSVKYPQSVMVWGAMSAAGVGPLCFYQGQGQCS